MNGDRPASVIMRRIASAAADNRSEGSSILEMKMNSNNEAATSCAGCVLPPNGMKVGELEFDVTVGFEKVKFALDALVISNSFAEQPAKDRCAMEDWRVQKL